MDPKWVSSHGRGVRAHPTGLESPKCAPTNLPAPATKERTTAKQLIAQHLHGDLTMRKNERRRRANDLADQAGDLANRAKERAVNTVLHQPTKKVINVVPRCFLPAYAHN